MAGEELIGSYDPALGQSSPVDPFSIEIDKRAKELQDLLDMRDMAKAEAEKAMAYTGRNPIEQAIVGLAPMALGALLGGKQGLGAGGIGAVAGLKAYDSYADEEAKRQQLIASQFYKDAQANVTASQKAMDALRGTQVTIDAKNQDALEMEARLAALPPPAFVMSKDPVADFGPDFSACITDEECEAIEAAWEATHAARK
jgi:hypothetical protein